MSARPVSAVGCTPVQHPTRGSAGPGSLTLGASDLGLEELHQLMHAQSAPIWAKLTRTEHHIPKPSQPWRWGRAALLSICKDTK